MQAITRNLSICAAAVVLAANGSATLAVSAQAQGSIPVRHLTPVVATDSGLLRTILGVRHLPDGRVLVNDFGHQRLITLDSTFAHLSVVADTAGAPQRYWESGGTLLPYVGDSSVFVHQRAMALIVLDSVGRVARTIAAPNPQDIMQLMSGAAVGQGFDPLGRLVYRTARRTLRQLAQPIAAGTADSGTTVVTVQHDSDAVVRADPITRRVDTVALIALPVAKTVTTALGHGRSWPTRAVNPLPASDAWAMLADGTVAIVRGIDYHVDWVSPDGTKSSTAKMPFDWRRVTDEEKLRMLDSAHKAFDASLASAPPPPPAVPIQRGGGGMETRSQAGASPLPKVFVGVDPSDMPDYYPPIRSGTMRADSDGNLWILPATSTLASAVGPVYDLINRKGEIRERVQIPAGRSIVGFGPGGVVYMLSQWARGVPRLERARVVR